jgi:hypothetical protein
LSENVHRRILRRRSSGLYSVSFENDIERDNHFAAQPMLEQALNPAPSIQSAQAIVEAAFRAKSLNR